MHSEKVTTFEKKQIHCHASKRYLTESLSHRTMWFSFQDILSNASNTFNQHTNQPILESIVLMFLVMFQYQQNIKLFYVWIQCEYFIKNVHCEITEEVGKVIILVFIKSVLFQHVGILLIIQSNQ